MPTWGKGQLTPLIRSSIRDVTAQFLTERCRIETRNMAYDEYGGSSETYTVTHDNVPCRVITAGARTKTQDVGSRETLQDEYRIAVPHNIEMTEDMRVVVDDVSYEVIRVVDNRTDETDRQIYGVRSRG